MKIYTRTGDTGQTGLYGGDRISKGALRIEACGLVDELNAQLGVVRAALSDWKNPNEEFDILLSKIQHHLFDTGAELATLQPDKKGTALLSDVKITLLESQIDRVESMLEPLREFILPGGTGVAAQLHVSRAVCRRAERVVVTLAEIEKIRPEVVMYLNRLSDLLFVLARYANHLTGTRDTPWVKDLG